MDPRLRIRLTAGGGVRLLECCKQTAGVGKDIALKRPFWIEQIGILAVLIPFAALIGCQKKAAPPARRTVAGSSSELSASLKHLGPLVSIRLPKTGLTISVPTTARVAASIIHGADRVKFREYPAALVVKPRLLVDKTLEKLEKWAKGHRTRKYVGPVLRNGTGKTYSLIYKVEIGERHLAVYQQMFRIGDKYYLCAAKAGSIEAAWAFKRSCDTISR